MADITNSDLEFKNRDCPFTELFSLLKRREESPSGEIVLGYNSNELSAIHQHVDNAIVMLIQGMQDVGGLLGIAINESDGITESLDNIGFFISGISNLMEALNGLRTDAGLQEHVSH